MIGLGAELNASSINRNLIGDKIINPLLIAIQYERIEIIKLLLKSGADRMVLEMIGPRQFSNEYYNYEFSEEKTKKIKRILLKNTYNAFSVIEKQFKKQLFTDILILIKNYFLPIKNIRNIELVGKKYIKYN